VDRRPVRPEVLGRVVGEPLHPRPVGIHHARLPSRSLTKAISVGAAAEGVPDAELGEADVSAEQVALKSVRTRSG
jgi:hypothetical protein